MASAQASTQTTSEKPASATRQATRHRPSTAVWAERIEGRYRSISVRHLALCWSSYKAGHISFRQFRIVMAAHEMAERRRYMSTNQDGQARRKPLYGIEELKSLVGGRGSATADAALATDIRALARLGLVTIADHDVRFAGSVDELNVDDIAFFWEMFDKLDHKCRSVPVPRRVLRALAGGFNAGTAAVVLATLIRSMFWRQDARADRAGGRGSAPGAYRVDGRTKREWIAEVFGVTPRTVTTARTKLIELGWLVPLDTPQWMLNRYGSHDAINTDWSASNEAGESSSPEGGSEGVSSTPDQNMSSSPTGNLETRRPRPMRAGPAGACRQVGYRRMHGNGEAKKQVPSKPKPPNIRDIRSADLADMGRLLQLHDQAIALGLAKPGEAGRLEFVALAERARVYGRRAGALFFYLLREHKGAFITQCAEDEASRRLKEHLFGKDAPRQQWGGQMDACDPQHSDHAPEHPVVLVCLRIGEKHGVDPARIARETKGWSRETWEAALADYENRRWRPQSDRLSEKMNQIV